MKPAARDREFRVSEMIYGRLLRAYPPRHRAEYGPAMAQLFRDQCRDAWNESQTWGLFKLWWRTVPDWASTSILERLAARKERRTMTEKLANLLGFRVAPPSTFFRVFVVVFVLVFGLSVAITFVLPESYSSTARIKVENDVMDIPGMTGTPSVGVYDPYFIQTTFEIMQSQLVLEPVIKKLKLNTVWGKKYYHGETLKTAETLRILQPRVQLRPVKNTKLIAITVFSDDPNEAAEIANAIAESYHNYRIQSREALVAQGLATLQQQYRDQEEPLQKAQAGVESLRVKFDVADNVEALETQLADAQKAVREKAVQLSELRAMSPAQRRNALPGLIAADGTLSDLLGKLNEAEQRYATLTNDYALSNPAVTRVSSLMNVLNQQIDDHVAGVLAGLDAQLDASRVASEDLAAKIQKSKPNPENQAYWDARKDLEASRESHKLLVEKIEAERLELHLPKTSQVQITDLAEPGRAPVRPNKPVNIVIGACAGIFLAACAGGFFALISYFIGRRMGKPGVAGTAAV